MDGNEYPEAELPLVDPQKDDWNLWALLDEGCNSTCHGEQWRIHAQAVLKRRGYAPVRLSDNKSSFSGIGEATCTGRWRFPIGLTMEPSTVPVHGTLDSAELAGKQTPLLFSLPAQRRLALIKDMRAGTCSMGEFPGECLHLARDIHSGLLLVCITQYGDGHYSNSEDFEISNDYEEQETAFVGGSGSSSDTGSFPDYVSWNKPGYNK